MIIKKRQVEGQPLTVIIEYPKWSEAVDVLEQKIAGMDLTFIGKTSI